MIYIWVRATLNWQDEAAFRSQLSPQLTDAVELWNDNFKVPYHLFRHRLSEIARLNHSRVEGARRAQWEAIPDGALVVPVDDDDWFTPTLATTLTSKQTTGIGAYYWPSHFLEVPIDLRHQAGRLRRKLFSSTPPVYLCTTNNYAIMKSPEAKSLLRKHTLASLWFNSNLDSGVKKIDESLSLMNRTLGSITSLRRKRGLFARQKILLALFRYRQIYRKHASPDLAWTQDYRDMMAALMEEL